MDSSGVKLEDPQAIQNEILGYYKELLGTPIAGAGDISGELRRPICTRVPEDKIPGLVQSVNCRG